MFQAYYVFWQAAYVAILSGFVTFYVFGALGFQQWQLVALERILIVIAAGMSGLFITKVIHEFLTPGLVVKDVIALGFQSTSTYYVLAGLLEESSKIAIGIALFFVFRRTGMRLPDAVILSALSFA